MTDSIDYRPLQNVRSATTRVLRDTAHGSLAVASVIYAIAIVAVVVMTHNGLLAFLMVAVYIAGLAALVARYDKQLWLQFAAANGWTINPATDGTKLLPPSLQFGHGRKAWPVINAQLAGQPARLISYKTTDGYGRSARTIEFTFAVVAAGRALPHILLDGKGLKSASTRTRFLAGQRLQLEGDFDKYFNLTMERGEQVDVLSVLTPDVMQRLKDYSQTEAIETSGELLFFIVNDKALDDTAMRQLLTSVIELQGEINQNIRLATGPGH